MTSIRSGANGDTRTNGSLEHQTNSPYRTLIRRRSIPDGIRPREIEKKTGTDSFGTGWELSLGCAVKLRSVSASRAPIETCAADWSDVDESFSSFFDRSEEAKNGAQKVRRY